MRALQPHHRARKMPYEIDLLPPQAVQDSLVRRVLWGLTQHRATTSGSNLPGPWGAGIISHENCLPSATEAMHLSADVADGSYKG